MEFDSENAEKSDNVELTDVQIQNKEDKSSGEVKVGESETAIDSDISDNASTSNVELDEINTNLCEQNFSDSICDAARISGCNENVLESGSQKFNPEKGDVSSNSTVSENSVENDKKLDDDDNSSNDSLLGQRCKLVSNEGDESDGSRCSETNRNLVVSEKPTSSLCIDEHKKDDLKTCKTEEEQLIEDVQNFYPEIELSKTQSDIIKEGKAYILKQTKNVFYNPVQEFNRDISVAAITVFAEEHRIDPRCQSRGTKRKANDKVMDDIVDSSTEPREAGVKYNDGIVILEALSATGLRSIRYAKEVPGVKEIVANDISIAAVESIKKNIEYNGVEDLVTTSHNDASLLMYMRKAQGNFFDVVDLDPYGCPSRFLDSAVQCVRDGGLLLITCTDMAVLAGNSPETCYVKYGAISLRNPACHEMALRITLQCIESHANKYGRYIIPQLSFSADFYIRVIVKVYTSPAMCKRTTSKLSMIYQCVGCQSFYYWPLGLTENCNNSIKYHLPRGPPVSQECPHCGSLYYQGGPIWNGSLHNITFVEKMLFQICEQEFNTDKRMEGMLELIREELVGTALYYTIDSLCSKVHCEVVPRNKFVSALLHAGYKVTLSHAAPNSIKTNAPSGVIWDIIRCWVKDHPVNPKRLTQGSVAEKLLSTIPRLQANFDLHPEVMPRNKRKLLRYQQNPQPFWGPGTRDKTNCSSHEKMNKSYTNQNKKHKRSNIEREKARMKAAINSKNIDIIEVVTLTDDDDDDNNDVKINTNDVNTKNKSDNIKKNDVISNDSIKNDKMETESTNESESIDVAANLNDSKINNDKIVEDNNLSTDNDVSDNENMVLKEDDDNENMVSNEDDDIKNMASNEDDDNENMVLNEDDDNKNMVSNKDDDNENMVINEDDDNKNMVSCKDDNNKSIGEPDKENNPHVEGDKTDINND